MKKLIAVAIVAAMGAVYASNGLKSISDVRVAPFIETHWGQKTDSGYTDGSACFNYFTPNNYSCGCVATAMAQILRYDTFPASAPAGEYLCAVDNAEQTLTIEDGNYDWANMPLDTRGGATAEQCQAIGKLTYDCAVAMHTHFADSTNKQSFAYGGIAYDVLTQTFGYDNAMGYCSRDSGVSLAAMKGAILANLDLRRPVMLQLLTDKGVGHQVLADGYGFEGGVLYVHIIFDWPQWSEICDGWYPLPNVEVDTSKVTYAFTKVMAVIYNIFPNGNYDILSGRVTDASGEPVSGAVVNVSYSSGNSKKSTSITTRVTTDDNGIYALPLVGGKAYTVSCGEESKKVTLKKSVCASCKWADELESPSLYKSGTFGNSWGNDFVIGGDDPTPDPTPDPVIDDELGVFNPAKAVSAAAPYCGAAYKADGSAGGTVSLKIGKASKKGISKVSGTVMTLDGKKYSIASTAFAVNTTGSQTVEGIAVKKLGTIDLTVGEKGFVATIKTAGGEIWDAATADLSLPAGTYAFTVNGLPQVIGGYQVMTNLSANGQSVAVSTKGKMDCGKAASIKYKKVDGSYVLWGTDDPKRPNLSGLKLTYTAKTGVVKGSFYIYANSGTDVKPKLKKTKATVYGLSVGGKVVGTATINKVGSYAISID